MNVKIVILLVFMAIILQPGRNTISFADCMEETDCSTEEGWITCEIGYQCTFFPPLIDNACAPQDCAPPTTTTTTTSTTTTSSTTTTTTTTVPPTTTTTTGGGGGDTTPPTGTVSITGQLVDGTNSPDYASSTAVTLALTCTVTGDCVQMKIVNDDFNDLTGASVYTFAASKLWTLSEDDALKTVYVIFKDAAGNWQANNAATAGVITLDTTAPGTTITSPLIGTTTSTSASIAFSGTDANLPLTFECERDGGGFVACSSPHAYTVAVGTHTFKVRAIDPAGNVDASPASETWTVSAPAGGGSEVKLYDNADYTGTMCEYIADATTLGTCNNIASSLKLMDGHGITLYENPNLKNGCRTFFQPTVNNLNNYAFNDNAESFKLWKSGMNGAILYDDALLSKSGNNEYYPADQQKYYLKDTDCVYNKAGSIEVSSGNIAILYSALSDETPSMGPTSFYPQSADYVKPLDVDWADYIRVCPKTSTNCLPASEDGVAPDMGSAIKEPTGFSGVTESVSRSLAANGIILFELANMKDSWISKCDITVKNVMTGTQTPYTMDVSNPVGLFDATRTHVFAAAGTYEVRFQCKDLAGNAGKPTIGLDNKEQFVKLSVCGTSASPKALGSLSLGGTKTGATCQMNDGMREDWFSVTTTASGRIAVSVDGPGSCDWDFQLKDAADAIKLSDGTIGVCDDTKQSDTLPAGAYKVRIYRFSGDGTGTVTVGLADEKKECETTWTKQQIVDAYKAKTGLDSCPGGIVPKCESNKLQCALFCAQDSECAPLDNRNTCCTADSSLGVDKLPSGQCVGKNSKIVSDKWICDPGTWMGCSTNNVGQIINSAGENFVCSYENSNYGWAEYIEPNNIVNRVVSGFAKALEILLNGIALRI